MSVRNTVNSFTQKPSPTQVLSYAVVLGDVAIFYACMTPNFASLLPNVILSAMFGVASLVVVVSALLTSINDPSDDVVWQHRKARDSKYLRPLT